MATVLTSRSVRRRPSKGIGHIDGGTAAARELLLVVVLYLTYTVCRLLADDGFAGAARRADSLHRVESLLHLHWEGPLNDWFAAHHWLGVFASYWYATGHYVVTGATLVWLFRRRRAVYVPARNALVGATLVALVCYLALPTAPPRLLEGFTDILSLHSDAGWWGDAASAPRGFGGATNQLAAFPSMHAGWALWVTLAGASIAKSRFVTTLGLAYALITGLVVVGTANHWVLDVLAGWLLVALAWWAVFRADAGKRQHSARERAADIDSRGTAFRR